MLELVRLIEATLVAAFRSRRRLVVRTWGSQKKVESLALDDEADCANANAGERRCPDPDAQHLYLGVEPLAAG